MYFKMTKKETRMIPCNSEFRAYALVRQRYMSNGREHSFKSQRFEAFEK